MRVKELEDLEKELDSMCVLGTSNSEEVEPEDQIKRFEDSTPIFIKKPFEILGKGALVKCLPLKAHKL